MLNYNIIEIRTSAMVDSALNAVDSQMTIPPSPSKKEKRDITRNTDCLNITFCAL